MSTGCTLLSSVSSRDLPLSAPNQPPCFLCQRVNVPVFKQSLISGKQLPGFSSDKHAVPSGLGLTSFPTCALYLKGQFLEMPLGQQGGSSCSLNQTWIQNPALHLNLGDAIRLCQRQPHLPPDKRTLLSLKFSFCVARMTILLLQACWSPYGGIHSPRAGDGLRVGFCFPFVSRATGGFVGSDASVHRLLY